MHNFQTVFDRSEIEHVCVSFHQKEALDDTRAVPKIEDSSARLENVIGSVRLRQAAELATLMNRVIETENVRISVQS